MKRNLINSIYNAESFLILTHVRPDADAISSAISMYYFLIDIGKKPENIDVFIPFISKDLKFIDRDNILTNECTMNEYDLVIILDCSDILRIEGKQLLEQFSSKQCILIDHHEKSGEMVEADYVLIDTKSASCTCIIYRNFSIYISEKNREFFTRCIAIGIMSDTIGFTHNVTEECKQILKVCKNNGVDIQKISEQLNNIDERTKYLSDIAINRIRREKNIIYSYIVQSDLTSDESTLKNVNHKAIILQILDKVPCITLVFFMENDNHEIKGSIRTVDESIDLNQICRTLVEQGYFIKGGGHANSAGFTMEIEEVTPETLNMIFNHLKNYFW